MPGLTDPIIYQYAQADALLGSGNDFGQLNQVLFELPESTAADLHDIGTHLVHQLLGAAISALLAIGQDGQAVAALGFVHVVGGHQDGGAGIAQVEEFFPELAAVFRVYRRGWFIEKQQFGFVDGGGCQAKALFLAAAHGIGQLSLLVI